MVEISGYASSTVNYQKTLQGKVQDSDQNLGEKKPQETQGVEVILSSAAARSEIDTYERLKKSAAAELSPTEQRALDDMEYELRNPESAS
ncbi:MAG TPA: hypothetical protein DEQ32_01880 [Gammaproteobacteria bacterium]|nr:hypothetical protein [Gammaproteobacteria bacterium]|tara:strand:+ start:369 stop:638 length:270 start_codon:yes stop_codon:yes gene_type:complete